MAKAIANKARTASAKPSESYRFMATGRSANLAIPILGDVKS